MYCKHCGKEIPDDSNVCMHCGTSVELKEDTHQSTNSKDSKTGVGVALGFFLSLIGLIIGFAIYPRETEARKTFLKGWWIGFLITFSIGFLIGIIRACAI